MQNPNGQGQILANKIPGSEWILSNSAAVGVQATVTQPAGGARVRNVVTFVCASLVPNLNTNSLVVPEVQLVDGATTISMGRIPSSGTVFSPPLIMQGDYIYKGSLNGALTLQMAPAEANYFEQVTMGGYQVIE